MIRAAKNDMSESEIELRKAEVAAKDAALDEAEHTLAETEKSAPAYK